jgi:hypothetical protein
MRDKEDAPTKGGHLETLRLRDQPRTGAFLAPPYSMKGNTSVVKVFSNSDD